MQLMPMDPMMMMGGMDEQGGGFGGNFGQYWEGNKHLANSVLTLWLYSK